LVWEEGDWKVIIDQSCKETNGYMFSEVTLGVSDRPYRIWMSNET
jgi:hypothetical protein